MKNRIHLFRMSIIEWLFIVSFRNSILRPGATRDAAELLRDFLGRDPENGPFLRSKGLKIE